MRKRFSCQHKTMNADGMDLQPSSIWTRNNSTALTAANRNEASSHVCERCSSWKLDRLFEPYEGSISARITRAELLESYDKACPFCEDLRAIFTQLNPDDNSSKSTDSIIIRQRLGAQDEPKWRTFSEFDLQGEALGKIPLLPLIDHESSPKFPFTHVTRIREPFVDYGAMRQWISCCKVNHKKCALPAPQPNHKDLEIYRRGFRAIDCVKKKFENVSGPEQFVALSYVWAQVPEQPNEQVAGRLPQILPQLIEDARIVTLELGIRFLWVDRYCITVCLSLTLIGHVR